MAAEVLPLPASTMNDSRSCKSSCSACNISMVIWMFNGSAHGSLTSGLGPHCHVRARKGCGVRGGTQRPRGHLARKSEVIDSDWKAVAHGTHVVVLSRNSDQCTKGPHLSIEVSVTNHEMINQCREPTAPAQSKSAGRVLTVGVRFFSKQRRRKHVRASSTS